MHRRQFFILYTVLSVTAALLIWRLVTEWKTANLRYHALPRARATVASVPPGSAPKSTPPVGDIVAKHLFSPDRNNTIAKDEKHEPPPPVPVVFGTMNLGGKYEALMAEGGQPTKTGFHRVKNGERVGGYTVVEIGDEKVVVDFQGQKTTLDVYQSASSVPPTQTRTGQSPPTVSGDGLILPGQSTPSPTASNTPAAPPTASAPPVPGANPNDPYVKVTIEGNRRRMERQTMFGTQVWYEDIPK